jgi:hypothetical protein
MLVVIALIAVMAFAGNAAALAEQVYGTLDTDAASGEVVMLWVEDDRTSNPGQNMSAIIGDSSLGLYADEYYFNDIEPLLLTHGKNPGDSFTVTIAVLCSGADQDGNSYANTYHNDTGVTATDTYETAGPTIILQMNLVTCAAEETFSKTLYSGWNLISLPLTPGDNSTSSVLASVWDNVDAVYGYNAETKQFEGASTMDMGEGYFVHATAGCTWEYSGTPPYTSMSTSLEPGLNMVGWLNCPEDADDALSSISGDYYYVARWNATAEKFEVYNPSAPSTFNDFTTMDRGTGYFISAKQECTLSESC